MSTRWKVMHKFTEPLAVASAAPGYPSMGVTLIYNPAGELTEINHEVELGDDAIEDHARAASQRDLQLFLEALEYRRGVPARVGNIHAFRTHPPVGMSVSLSATATVSCDAVVVRQIRFPAEAALVSAAPRLMAWLHMANRATHENDEHAIRDYFLIVEESIGTALPSGSQAQCVKFIRHFVSHPKLSDPKAVAFINSELGLSASGACPAYDPRDPFQRAMLRRWRAIAQTLAHAEIDKLL